jgi:hypothetical protein
MTMVSKVELDVENGRSEVTDREKDEIVCNGLQRPRLRCCFGEAPRATWRAET